MSGDTVQCLAWHTASFGRNTPGILTLADGRLSFRESKDRDFDVPVAEVSGLTFAWGDSVMKCVVGGRKYRFYFARPQGAAMLPGDVIAGVQGVKGFFDSRSAGKAFKDALGEPPG